MFFNHPLITPISTVSLGGAGALAAFIPLQASRTMVNESFRPSRVVNLPSNGANTYTPTNTPTPSKTPIPTAIPTLTLIPSQTPTTTPSYTASPSATPNCALVSMLINSAALTPYSVNLPIKNQNSAPLRIYGATIHWYNVSKQPTMFFSSLTVAGQPQYAWAPAGSGTVTPGLGTGSYTMPSAPANGAASGGWTLASPPDYALRSIAANTTSTIQLGFTGQSPSDMTLSGLTINDFSGTAIRWIWAVVCIVRSHSRLRPPYPSRPAPQQPDHPFARAVIISCSVPLSRMLWCASTSLTTRPLPPS